MASVILVDWLGDLVEGALCGDVERAMSLGSGVKGYNAALPPRRLSPSPSLLIV